MNRRQLQNLRSIEHRRNLRIRAVELKGGKCKLCQYDKCIGALEFHHRDPSKKDFSIGSGTSLAWATILEETEKCDLLCANCHRELHANLRVEKDNQRRALVLANSKPIVPRVDTNCQECGMPVRKTGRYKPKYAFCSMACSKKFGRPLNRHTIWPSRDELEKLVSSIPATEIGKMFGVSGRAIEKWCRRYGLKTKPRGYWQKVYATREKGHGDQSDSNPEG